MKAHSFLYSSVSSQNWSPKTPLMIGRDRMREKIRWKER
jgi:hypothetical protein